MSATSRTGHIRAHRRAICPSSTSRKNLEFDIGNPPNALDTTLVVTGHKKRNWARSIRRRPEERRRGRPGKTPGSTRPTGAVPPRGAEDPKGNRREDQISWYARK